jgi:chromatin modification-related protein EAF6
MNSKLIHSQSLELQGEDSDSPGAETPKFPNTGLQTVMLPPATRQQELSAAQIKKERDRLYQRQKRARKESRATASGDENDYSAAGTSSGRRKRPKIADDD